MATISVKLKIIADKDTKNKIEQAHIFFNEQVREFEKLLLLARAKDYYYTDDEGVEHYKSKEEAEQDLEDYLSKRKGIKDIEECKTALGMLESVVVSKGSQAAGMLTKLYNKNSTAGTNNISKIVDPLPEWVDHFIIASKSFDEEKYKKMADDWVISEAGKKAIAPIMEKSGRPSSFKLAYLQNKEWYYSFIKDQETYRKDLKDGLARMISILDSNNALPVLDISTFLSNEYPVWVKLYLKIALENFASYIACDNETRNNYQIAKNAFDIIDKEVQGNYRVELEKVLVFLDENYYSDNRKIYLTKRMCRGFKPIFIEWKKCGNYEERLKVINKYRTVKSRQIGDANFLKWLAEDDNQCLATQECIEKLLDYFRCLRDVDMKRKCASYTAADSVTSKRYLFYENPKGSNFKKYIMSMEDGLIKVIIPILLNDKNENIYQEDISFKLAPNKQFQVLNDQCTEEINLEFVDGNRVCFTNSKKILLKDSNEMVYESFTGTMGGADIRVVTNGIGKLKDAFMSIALNVDKMNSLEHAKMADNALNEFRTSYSEKRTKWAEELDGKTIRALSIDLGLKQFGAVAVGQIKYDKKTIDLQKYNIERMFMLKLDGEDCSSYVEKERANAWNEIKELRTKIRYFSFLKHIYNLEDMNKRRKLLTSAIEHTQNPDKHDFMKFCLDMNDKKQVDDCLKQEYDALISEMNSIIKEFRSAEIRKRQKRNYVPGKSIWSISYLEELRKMIMAWNSLGYHIDDDNIKMDIKYGVTATKLLEHINNLKDDRIKTGADLVIQSAMGYVYDSKSGCWIQKYDPCHVIIFEDLSRYRFKSDRPRQENTKLMQWSHREIVEEVKRQAALYGISVFDSLDASYSSKFYHITDAPGIRCDRLSRNSFDSEGKLNKSIREKLPEKMLPYTDDLKVGSLVPSEIGSIFATLNEEGKLVLVNADMNAACNLQKRFWGRHTHLYRIATVNVSGILKIKSDVSDDDKDLGKREKGKYLYHFGSTKLSVKDSGKKGHFHVGVKTNSDKPVEVGEAVYNLFHDASGIFFGKDEWVGYTEFWNTVEDVMIDKLIEQWK